jgi:hypothetical protein
MIDKSFVLTIVKKYKNEILEQLDWWYGFDNHDLNVFCMEDEPYEPDAVFHFNVYTLGKDGVNDMYEEEQNMMPPMTREEIRLL